MKPPENDHPESHNQSGTPAREEFPSNFESIAQIELQIHGLMAGARFAVPGYPKFSTVRNTVKRHVRWKLSARLRKIIPHRPGLTGADYLLSEACRYFPSLAPFFGNFRGYGSVRLDVGMWALWAGPAKCEVDPRPAIAEFSEALGGLQFYLSGHWQSDPQWNSARPAWLLMWEADDARPVGELKRLVPPPEDRPRKGPILTFSCSGRRRRVAESDGNDGTDGRGISESETNR